MSTATSQSTSSSLVRFEDYPKLVIGPGYFACPICRHTCDRLGKADGFRKAGMYRHIGACFRKQLAAAGLRLGNWSHARNGYRIVRARS